MTIVDEIAEVKREIGLRKIVYPKWAKDGNMTSQQIRQIEVMTAVLHRLERIQAEEEGQGKLF